MSEIVNRIGVCSWCLPAKDPSQLIAMVRETGVSTIQLNLMPLMEKPGWADTATHIRDAGIAIASGMVGTLGENYSTLETIAETGGVVLDENWPANWERFQNAAALAQRLALPLVSFHAGFITRAGDGAAYEKIAERVGKIADLFQKHHVRVILETGQETADDLLAFLDDLDHPNLGVNFDPGNMILYAKGDPVASIKKLIKRVEQIHLKDAKRTEKPGTWGTEMVLGQGEVDWPAFIEMLKANDYAGDLIIEREAGKNGVGDIITSARVIGELLGDRAG